MTRRKLKLKRRRLGAIDCQALFRAACDGSLQAFRTLFWLCFHTLCRFLRARLKSRQAQRVQEQLESGFEHVFLHRGDFGRWPQAWAYLQKRIRFRIFEKEKEKEKELSARERFSTSPEKQLEEIDLQDLITQFARTLPKDKRMVFSELVSGSPQWAHVEAELAVSRTTRKRMVKGVREQFRAFLKRR